jgi:hypothetical protein
LMANLKYLIWKAAGNDHQKQFHGFRFNHGTTETRKWKIHSQEQRRPCHFGIDGWILTSWFKKYPRFLQKSTAGPGDHFEVTIRVNVTNSTQVLTGCSIVPYNNFSNERLLKVYRSYLTRAPLFEKFECF